jgi:hypothetical protein
MISIERGYRAATYARMAAKAYLTEDEIARPGATAGRRNNTHWRHFHLDWPTSHKHSARLTDLHRSASLYAYADDPEY